VALEICKLLELFIDTLNKCGVYLLEMEDTCIGYNIFEEFDIGAISFLHDNTLKKLKGANLINDNIAKMSSELRSNFLALQDTDLWNVDSVKHATEWRNILELSDIIKLQLELYNSK